MKLNYMLFILIDEFNINNKNMRLINTNLLELKHMIQK